MIRTRPLTLIIVGAVGLLVSFLGEFVITRSGQASVTLPAPLGIVLVVFSALVIGWAWPIRRATRERATRRIDPFWATRVLALAKACALTGAFIAGIAAGVIIFLLTRPVVSSTGALFSAVVVFVAALILLSAGLVAEYFCVVPPDDRDDDKGEQ